MTVVLQANDVHHQFATRRGRLSVLEGIDLQVESGQLIGICGESGSGKTTLLLICGSMLAPSKGNVRIAGKDVAELSAQGRAELRAKQIGFLFQTLQLIPYLSLKDNVRLAGKSTAADSLIEQLQLSDRAEHKPDALSVGQRQRGALARGLANDPALLIADEPTGNLDVANSSLVFQTLRSFADSGGAVLVASHDPGLMEYTDACFHLVNGTLTQQPDS